MNQNPIVNPTEEQRRELRGVIYGIRNKTDQKIYIGQSRRSFCDRYRNKWWKDIENIHLKHSIAKYGHENFEVIIFEHSIVCKEELNKLEDQYAKLFNSYSPNGYNFAPCGHNKDRTFSQEYYENRQFGIPFRVKHFATGEIFEGINIKKFAKEKGISATALCKALKNKGHVTESGYTHADTTQDDIDNKGIYKRWKISAPVVVWRDNVKYEIRNIKKFMKEHELTNTRYMGRMLNGKLLHYKRFSSQNIKITYSAQRWANIKLKASDGTIHQFENIFDYKNKMGEKSGDILALLSGENKMIRKNRFTLVSVDSLSDRESWGSFVKSILQKSAE